MDADPDNLVPSTTGSLTDISDTSGDRHRDRV